MAFQALMSTWFSYSQGTELRVCVVGYVGARLFHPKAILCLSL